MAGDHRLSPPIIWAQRGDKLYLTINLEDIRDEEIKLEEDKLHFKGKGGADQKDYELTIEFFKEVNPKESKFVVLPRHIPMMIKKKEDGPYWDRLLKEKTKVHWLKTDFSKWRDEDDSDVEEGEDMALEDMMKQMGNFSAGGGGVEQPDLGTEADAEDSDDEDLPDLEQSAS